MKKYITAISALVVVSAVLVAQGGRSAGEAPVSPGKAAPNFEAVDSNGKTRSLSEFKGKYVVLEWSNHDCPFVRKHYGPGAMQETQKWATAKGAVWLTIVSSAPGTEGYVNGPEANQLMKSSGHKSTAMLLDPSGKVGRAYGARTTPHMYVIGPDGTLLYMGAIDDKRSANPADIPGARNHVRAALDEAMSGKAVSVPSTQPYGCSVKYGS